VPTPSAAAPALVPWARARPRITIRLDDEIIGWFRHQVEMQGGDSCQTMIDQALCADIFMSDDLPGRG
jgi:uncharacterized protein (DUF4415 family)